MNKHYIADAEPFSGRNDVSRRGLPAWAYWNDELAELEKEVLFRRNWLLVGHINQIPNPGDYMCLNEVDERAIVIRGNDGVVRGFHNLCRHRGSRVTIDETGNAGRAITCPFHGWCYNLDGSLRGVPQPETFPGLDKEKNGLKPLDLEIWHGLVFVRFKGVGPSVAEMAARYEPEIAPYRIEDMVPIDWGFRENYDINWKAVLDVDNEGYHVATAHPSLNALFTVYVDEDLGGGLNRAFGDLRDAASGPWSVRAYLNLLPKAQAGYLPETHQKKWVYLALFPNLVITLYPDGSADYYQTFPGQGQSSAMRGSGLAPGGNRTRESLAVRYLKDRIDRTTVEEDANLVRWTWEAMRSSAYDGVQLSDAECGVIAYHEALRRALPVLTLPEAPAPGTIAARNAELGGTVD
ncbi:MAG: aromatic ring-hydroxylating dioxygenase subunit alpha [Rhodospirillales bacterium]